jgi:hypothetical protein
MTEIRKEDVREFVKAINETSDLSQDAKKRVRGLVNYYLIWDAAWDADVVE